MKTTPRSQLIKELLTYDPETGDLTWRRRNRKHFASARDWRRWNNRYADKVAGGLMDKGYVRVRVLGARLYAHRVAWLLMTGVWPDEVDHVNRDRADNRWHNLRSGSHLANMQNVSTYSNNTTGFTGVYRRSSGWVAHSRGGSGTRRYLGHFKDVNDAIAARKESENAC